MTESSFALLGRPGKPFLTANVSEAFLSIYFNGILTFTLFGARTNVFGLYSSQIYTNSTDTYSVVLSIKHMFRRYSTCTSLETSSMLRTNVDGKHDEICFKRNTHKTLILLTTNNYSFSYPFFLNITHIFYRKKT